MRQYICGNVYQQERGSPQPNPLLCLQTVCLLQWCHRHKITLRAAHLPGEENKIVGHIIQESLSNNRQTQSKRFISGVAPSPRRLQNPVQSSSASSDRSIRQCLEPPATDILQLGKRPEGIRPGRFSHQLEHDPGVRISTDSVGSSGSEKAPQLQVLQDHPHRPQVAMSAVVPETGVAAGRATDSPDFRRDLIKTKEGHNLPRQTLQTLSLTAWPLSSDPIKR